MPKQVVGNVGLEPTASGTQIQRSSQTELIPDVGGLKTTLRPLDTTPKFIVCVNYAEPS